MLVPTALYYEKGALHMESQTVAHRKSKQAQKLAVTHKVNSKFTALIRGFM